MLNKKIDRQIDIQVMGKIKYGIDGCVKRRMEERTVGWLEEVGK
jgi:hypothetical protein